MNIESKRLFVIVTNPLNKREQRLVEEVTQPLLEYIKELEGIIKENAEKNK